MGLHTARRVDWVGRKQTAVGLNVQCCKPGPLRKGNVAASGDPECSVPAHWSIQIVVGWTVERCKPENLRNDDMGALGEHQSIPRIA